MSAGPVPAGRRGSRGARVVTRASAVALTVGLLGLVALFLYLSSGGDEVSSLDEDGPHWPLYALCFTGSATLTSFVVLVTMVAVTAYEAPHPHTGAQSGGQ